MRTIKTIQSAFAALLGIAGCAPSGDLAKPTTISAPLAAQQAVTRYEFIQHGPAVELDRATHYLPSDLSCAAQCVADWKPARLACDSVASPGCHAEINAGAAACIESACYERHDALAAPACTTRCADEATATQSDCAGPDCMAEAADVYSVCYDAECRDGKVATRLADRLADRLAELGEIREAAGDDGPTASEGPTGFDCEAACAAYEVQDYLGCVTDHPSNGAACRERSGAAYESCMTTHCPAD